MILSIITINRNNAEGLERTIQSVANQSFRDLEYIVIDGASTDRSVEIIEKKSNHITYWVSEKDSGIYNAMNKGIQKARGDYLLFLNSGDYLVDNESLSNVFALDYTEDLIYGDLIFKKNTEMYRYNCVAKLSASFLLYGTLPHPATFIKRMLFNTVGMYDETISISADHDFFQRAILKYDCSYRHIDVVVSVFIQDGVSCDIANRDKIRNEHHYSFNKNFPLFYEDYIELLEYRRDSVYSFVRKNRNNRFFLFYIKVFRKICKLANFYKVLISCIVLHP